MKIAYFAHSKLDYDKEKEHQTKARIAEFGFRVFCPNKNLGETGNISHYLRVLDWCDLVFALEHDGYIGRGVYAEIERALSIKKPCFVIRKNLFYKIISIKQEPSGDWRIRYGKIKADTAAAALVKF